MSERYAIYWTPRKDSELENVGQRWLGRDIRSGKALSRPTVQDLAPDRIPRITEEPARYGLHATLKPPFALNPGVSLETLLNAAQQFAQTRPPVHLEGLRLARLGHFLALVPSAPSDALQSLANDCVSYFDRFRRPPGTEEIARRRAANLSLRQETLLMRWGYPYVFDEFRFHVTLTGRLPDTKIDDIQAALAPLFSSFADAAIAIDALSVFVQPAPEQPFVLAQEFDLIRAAPSV